MSRKGGGLGPFVWRGIEFAPSTRAAAAGYYSSAPSSAGDRSADWSCQRLEAIWHARLRIGGDRFPGVGATAELALEDAAREAANVAALIVTMLPRAKGARAPLRKRTRRGKGAA
jgi:hypothetical protein